MTTCVAALPAHRPNSRNQEPALIVIGNGQVGSALLDMLDSQPFRVCAIANSSRMICDVRGIDLAGWRERLAASTERSSVMQLLHTIGSLSWRNVAVVDCTASDEIVDAYGIFVEMGAHVITPNKKANVLRLDRYRQLRSKFAQQDRRFYFRANVGAGLPVLSTLSDLVTTGDSIIRIEGVLSGTLSYLFNHFDGSRPFSALVEEARKRGFTEPDPRIDLRGEDVAIKLVVMARQLGWDLEVQDVTVENLLDLSDGEMAERYLAAAAAGCVLRYAGRLEGGCASAGLVSVPQSHPFARTGHTDNLVMFHTRRYSTTPLVIQGPGAGPEVTAAGVLADLHRLATGLPS